MGKLVTVGGRTLELSDKQPQLEELVFTVKGTDAPASRTDGAGEPLLLDHMLVKVSCKGPFSPAQFFEGDGEAEIVAATTRVRCEGKAILLDGDHVVVVCKGELKDSSGTHPATTSVRVTIKVENQNQILATAE